MGLPVVTLKSIISSSVKWDPFRQQEIVERCTWGRGNLGTYIKQISTSNKIDPSLIFVEWTLKCMNHKSAIQVPFFCFPREVLSKWYITKNSDSRVSQFFLMRNIVCGCVFSWRSLASFHKDENTAWLTMVSANNCFACYLGACEMHALKMMFPYYNSP